MPTTSRTSQTPGTSVNSIITSATKADIQALVSLVNNAYRGEDGQQGWTHEANLLTGSRTDAAGIEELMLTPQAVILKATSPKGAIDACVYLQKQGDKLYLGLLSVLPSKQDTGIGKHLLNAATNYARLQHCKTIRITVISARTELLAWYERHGYERTGEIEPFHAGEKFGIQKQPLELIVLEKTVN